MALDWAKDEGAVLFVHPSNDVYGSDRSALRTVQALGARGPVSFLLREAGPLTSVEVPGSHARVVGFDVLRKAGASSLFGQFLMFLRIYTLGVVSALREVRRSRPALVYVNTIICPQWIVAARLLRIPVVVHVREIEGGLARFVQFGLLVGPGLSTVVVANSHATARWVGHVRPDLRTKITVVHNGLDRPAQGAPRPNATEPSDASWIVIVGRLSERKGQQIAVTAFAQVWSTFPDARLVLVGDQFGTASAYAERLRQQAAALGVVERIDFVGRVIDPWPYYDRATVVLVPSLQEPFGNVAVEAGLAGRAAIVSRVEGLREIVLHDRTGLLVEPGDANDLACALSELLADPGRTRRLGEAAREHVSTAFSLDAYEQAVCRLTEPLRHRSVIGDSA